MRVDDAIWKEFCAWAEIEETKPDVIFSIVQSDGALRAWTHQGGRIVVLEAVRAALKTALAKREAEIKRLRIIADAAGELDANTVGVGRFITPGVLLVREEVVTRIQEAWLRWKTEAAKAAEEKP